MRLKKYRFFNMGKDHEYLDDYANRAIMQKVARECYLPMNELLAGLIRKNGKKFKVSFSISGIAVEQFRMYGARSAGQLPGVGAYGLRRVLGRNVFAFAGGAGRPGRIRGSGEAALCVDGEGIRA